MTTDVAQVMDALEHLPDAPPEARDAVGAGLVRALGLTRRLPEPPLEDFRLMYALGLAARPEPEPLEVAS